MPATTETRRLVIDQPDFRAYEVEECKKNGETIRYRVCESLENGRWEGFVSIQSTQAFRRAMGKESR